MVDVEREFQSFVRSFGGEVIADRVGLSPNFANADYLFASARIIIELKRLVADKKDDASLKAKIQAKFDKWVKDGTVAPIFGRVRIESKTLPLHCQRELLDVFKPPLQRRIIKANKQIKATLDRLQLKDYKGLLLIVNDGNYALEADAALYLIGRILGRNFRHIHSVIYCTVNMPASAPVTTRNVLIWAHATRKSVAEPVDEQWVLGFHRGWSNHLARQTGEPIEQLLAQDSSLLDHIRYIKGTS